MGRDVTTSDDEDEMVMAMKAVKAVNPSVATYFYMNSFKDHPEMTRMSTAGTERGLCFER